jgi:hypothetical protein
VAKLAGGDEPIDRATLVVSPKLDAQSSMRYPYCLRIHCQFHVIRKLIDPGIAVAPGLSLRSSPNDNMIVDKLYNRETSTASEVLIDLPSPPYMPALSLTFTCSTPWPRSR